MKVVVDGIEYPVYKDLSHRSAGNLILEHTVKGERVIVQFNSPGEYEHVKSTFKPQEWSKH